MLFRFNRLTLLANIFSFQFTEISEYQPSSSYRESKSRFFPYIYCKFCRVCPTTKMTSATVRPSIPKFGTVFTQTRVTYGEIRKQNSNFHKGLELWAKSINDFGNFERHFACATSAKILAAIGRSEIQQGTGASFKF